MPEYTYKGCLITPFVGTNTAGFKWQSYVANPVRGAGFVYADTLDGIREMIRWARGEDAA